jgi:hypothetical protein
MFLISVIGLRFYRTVDFDCVQALSGCAPPIGGCAPPIGGCAPPAIDPARTSVLEQHGAAPKSKPRLVPAKEATRAMPAPKLMPRPPRKLSVSVTSLGLRFMGTGLMQAGWQASDVVFQQGYCFAVCHCSGHHVHICPVSVAIVVVVVIVIAMNS